MNPLIADPSQPAMAPQVMQQDPRSSLAGLLSGGVGRPATSSPSLIDPTKVSQLVSAINGNSQGQIVTGPDGALRMVPQTPSDQYAFGAFGRALSQKPLSQAMGWFQPSAMNAYSGGGMNASPLSASTDSQGFNIGG